MSIGPKAPSLISHDDFRKTEGYTELCAEFGVDPAKGWDTEVLASIDDAVEFLTQYETMRRACSGYTAEEAAAYFEGIALRHEAEPAAIVVLDRFGDVLVVQDPLGSCWELTAARANPERVALALTKARINATPPN
jgi:hypothetical protein